MNRKKPRKFKNPRELKTIRRTMMFTKSNYEELKKRAKSNARSVQAQVDYELFISKKKEVVSEKA